MKVQVVAPPERKCSVWTFLIFSRYGLRRAGSMHLALQSSTGDALNFFLGLSLLLPSLTHHVHVSQKKKHETDSQGRDNTVRRKAGNKVDWMEEWRKTDRGRRHQYTKVKLPVMEPRHSKDEITLKKKHVRKKRRTFPASWRKSGSTWTRWENYKTNWIN